MNIECTPDIMTELESAFRFNDAVIRNLTLIQKEAITEASPMAKSGEEKEYRRDDRTAENAPAASEEAPAASEEAPATSEEAPATSEEIPAVASEEALVASESAAEATDETAKAE
jgi:small subunit ribosomal protein S6